MTKTLLTLCAAAAAISFAGEAMADQRATERSPTAAQVDLSRVDFQNPASVKSFYTRLHRAARDVCDSGISDRNIRRADAACERAALDRAVAQLSKPLLTARHETKSATAYARGY